MKVQRSLPTFEKPEEPDPRLYVGWRIGFYRNLGRLERRFNGRGPTYPAAWIRLILEGIVPEWVFRGILFAPDEEHRKRCEKARLALERLHGQIFEKGNQEHE